MGCDIHLRVERKINGVWRKVLPLEEIQDPWYKEQAEKHPNDAWYQEAFANEWYHDRNYKCFSILANVRNGFGSAGVDTGDCFIPISEPRGLPGDLGPDLLKDIKENETSDEGGGWWPGEHSFSWLLVSELLAYNWNRLILNRRVITLDAFIERIKTENTSWPESYCGGVSGPGVITLSRNEALVKLHGVDRIVVPINTKVYVQEEWESTYSKAAGRFHSQVLPALAKIDPNPSNVRIVFGFDS